MQNINSIVEIIGFDLGHGESALTFATVSASTEPQILDIQNEKSFITAVAQHPKRGIIIGEEAYTARNLDSLYIQFKSADLDNPKVRGPIKLFVQKVLELLQQNHLIRGQEASLFIVGCPSGWNPNTREKYIQLLREVGLHPVNLIAESRAAFIHAKESSELHISPDVLRRSVLIVDIGSSTTDFTAVHNLNEHYIDFGDIALGAGLLDKAILNRILVRHERQQELRQIFEKYPQYEAMCELKCRHVKEIYFANESRWVEEPVSDALKLPAARPIFFDVELKQQDMAEILSQPILGDFTWPAAFKKALRLAQQQLTDNPPELIFLTGGASRMSFTSGLCQAVFPTALIIRGKEPELSIAKGLAWSGRIDQKTKMFRREIETFFNSGQLQNLVDNTIPQLLEGVAEILVDALPEHVVLPAINDWQYGHIRALNDLEPEIESRTEKWLMSREGKRCLTPAVETWFRQISPQIEESLNPICDKYNIPRTAFSLLSNEVWHGKLPPGLVTDVNKLWGFDGFNTITGLIVSIVIANLMGGAGIALILQGPVGFVIGLVIGIVAFAVGKQTADWWIKQADLYLWIRKLARENRLRNKLIAHKEALKKEVLSSLQENQETLKKLKHDVNTSIQSQLNKSVETVVLLIK